MRVPGLKHLKLYARWWRSRFVNGGLILGYHRFVEKTQDSYAISVTPQHFAEQLETLNQHAHIMPLPKLARTLYDGTLPPRAVAITFDDGYADVLHHAKPLLERYQTPATVFITTGSLGCEFWWDKLERVLVSSAALPERLSLRITDRSYEWVLGDPREHRAFGSRRHIVQSIHRALLPLSPVERESAMMQLCAWSETAPDHRSSPRAMTSDELIELAAGDLIDIGAHTVTHPLLAGLPISAQRAEIRESKAHLEELLGRAVTAFAYPNGSSSHDTLTLVREAGYSCACASYNDVVWRGSDCFHLPRFWIPDWDGNRFERWLRGWL
jgi:peptidoglycan/xylan/chitin deacetylase (PgdA/CDA1 family)